MATLNAERKATIYQGEITHTERKTERKREREDLVHGLHYNQYITPVTDALLYAANIYVLWRSAEVFVLECCECNNLAWRRWWGEAGGSIPGLLDAGLQPKYHGMCVIANTCSSETSLITRIKRSSIQFMAWIYRTLFTVLNYIAVYL